MQNDHQPPAHPESAVAVLVEHDGSLVLANPHRILAVNPRPDAVAAIARDHTVYGETDSGSPRHVRNLTVALRAAQLDVTFERPQGVAAAIANTTAASAILANTDDDLLWRDRARVGLRADMPTITTRLRGLDARRQRIIDEVGTDLTRADKAAVTWLGRRGIGATVTNNDRGFAEVTIPNKEQVELKLAEHPELHWWAEARSVARDYLAYRPLARHGTSGRFHPTIDVNAARTGRMSVRKPALQGVRKDVRDVLIADPGFVLVAADSKNAELRVAAELVNDDDFTAAVEQGDIYETVAAYTGQTRKVAKNATVAKLYGQTHWGLAEQHGPENARKIRSAIRKLLPAMEPWVEEVKRSARRGDALHTLYGRPLPDSTLTSRKAPNLLVQGSARDAFGIGVRAVAAELGSAAMWLPIHDEIVVMVPEADAEDAARVLAESFAVTLPGGIRLPAEPKILGPNFRAPLV